MQELNYYNESEEINLNGNDYTLEVNISGVLQLRQRRQL